MTFTPRLLPGYFGITKLHIPRKDITNNSNISFHTCWSDIKCGPTFFRGMGWIPKKSCTFEIICHLYLFLFFKFPGWIERNQTAVIFPPWLCSKVAKYNTVEQGYPSSSVDGTSFQMPDDHFASHSWQVYQKLFKFQ